MSTASFPKDKPDTDPKDNIDVLSKPNIEIPINPDLLAQYIAHDPIIVPNIVITNDPVPSGTPKPENADNVVVIVISPAAKDSLIKDNFQAPIESTRLEKDNSKMIEPNQSESSARENITFTCPICYGEYETTLSKKLTCQHTFCKDCLELYIKTKIAGFEPASIRCPQSSCISLIGQETIEGLLDANSLEQYKKLIEIRSRFRNYQAKFCPQPGCSRELTVKSGEEFTQCQCGALICNQCFQIKHDGRSCADILRDNDDLYSNNKDVKMCIICKTKVEKTVGCSKVQCLVCDYVWCWDCGRESEPGHMMRCTRVWDPKAPEKLTKPKQSTCERIWSGLFLIIGMIFFILFMMIASLIVWPFIGTSVITEGKPNTSCMKILLAFLFSLLVWPLVVIVGPIAAAVDEYGSSMTGRKRWLNGGAKSFGLNNRQKTAQVDVLPEIRVPIIENAGNQERNEGKEGLQNDVRIDIS